MATFKTYATVIFVAIITYYLLYYVDNQDEEDVFLNASLKGKNVLLTGASSGIGEQIAYWYARYGANVFITARREALLKKVVDKCTVINPDSRFSFLVADMSSDDDRVQLVKTAVEFYGDIDQLILNHAYMPDVYRWSGSREQMGILNKIINTNFISYVHLTALGLPSLENTRGSISVTGSTGGRLPGPFMLEYSSSKFAIDGFFSGLRHEFKATRKNVSVTHSVIGAVDTASGSTVLDKVVDIFKLPKAFFKLIMPVGDASSTARAIISATTRRQGELYYPRTQGIWFTGVMRSLAPEFHERFTMDLSAAT